MANSGEFYLLFIYQNIDIMHQFPTVIGNKTI